MTHYQVLEIPQNAPAADVRRAYRRLVLLTHPDRTPDPAAHARYLAVNAAYEVLSDPGRRAAYDARLRVPAGNHPSMSPGRARDAARRTARRASAPRPAPTNKARAANYAAFLRVARPVMLGALLLCASLLLDVLLARQQPESVLRTDGVAYQHIIHYTSGGRFSLEEEVPPGTKLWVTRTPLWRIATDARLPHTGLSIKFDSLYSGTSNAFWLGLLLAAAIALRRQFSNDQRLIATLVAAVFLILTLSGLFSL